MPRAAVGLYCAVVERFAPLVSTCATAARETQAVFNPRAESLRTWLGALNLGLVLAPGCAPSRSTCTTAHACGSGDSACRALP